MEGWVQSWVVGFVSPGFEGGLQSLLGFSVLGVSSQVVEFPGIVLKVVELELGRVSEGVESCADGRSSIAVITRGGIADVAVDYS